MVQQERLVGDGDGQGMKPSEWSCIGGRQRAPKAVSLGRVLLYNYCRFSLSAFQLLQFPGTVSLATLLCFYGSRELRPGFSCFRKLACPLHLLPLLPSPLLPDLQHLAWLSELSMDSFHSAARHSRPLTLLLPFWPLCLSAPAALHTWGIIPCSCSPV